MTEIGGRPTTKHRPRRLPGLRRRFRRLLTRRPGARHQLVTDPQAVPAAGCQVPGEALVLGVEVDGEARVYPASILGHVVNDVVGDQEIVVTFCRRCLSGVAYAGSLAGERLTFSSEVKGGHEGALTMFDEQTGSRWAQLTGEALSGPLAGTRLRPFPIRMSTWGSWLREYPESRTPDIHPPHGHHTARRWEAPRRWLRSVSVRDDRLPARQLVLGVSVDTVAHAYPLDRDEPGPRLLQSEVGGVPVALLAPEGAWPLAYDRRTRKGVVDLARRGNEIVGADDSTWDGDGTAVSGPMAGTRLEFIPSMVAEWYAWAANYPGTKITRTPPA